MDPRYSGDVLKHLEKQQELLTEAAQSMSHELEKLQVEEEMLMRKFYEIMSAKGFTKKNEDLRNEPSDDGGEMQEVASQAADPSQKGSPLSSEVIFTPSKCNAI